MKILPIGNVIYLSLDIAFLAKLTGYLAIIAFLITAAIPILNKKGINIIPKKFLFPMTVISFALAIIHVAIGLI